MAVSLSPSLQPPMLFVTLWLLIVYVTGRPSVRRGHTYFLLILDKLTTSVCQSSMQKCAFRNFTNYHKTTCMWLHKEELFVFVRQRLDTFVYIAQRLFEDIKLIDGQRNTYSEKHTRWSDRWMKRHDQYRPITRSREKYTSTATDNKYTCKERYLSCSASSPRFARTIRGCQ